MVMSCGKYYSTQVRQPQSQDLACCGFFLYKIKYLLKGKKKTRRRGHLRECKETAVRCPSNSVPGMLPSVKATLDKVYFFKTLMKIICPDHICCTSLIIAEVPIISLYLNSYIIKSGKDD